MTERTTESPGPPAPAQAARPTVVDRLSAMTPRFNVFFRWFARRFFRHFDLDDKTVASLRELERAGSVVYVMRYASRLDYFLFNTLFVREGLRLSSCANGLHFYYYRPLAEGVAVLRQRLTGRLRSDHAGDCAHARESALQGGSQFLFLRTARLAGWLRGRRAAIEAGRQELDCLDEVVRAAWSGGRRVHLVPLALFWRKGPRAERRFLNLAYGAQTRPSDLAKVTSFLTTYRGLHVKVGDPIDLTRFVGERRHEGEEALVRKVRRSMLVFFYREEKAVEGPTLKPRHKVQEEVLSDPRVQAAIEEYARARGRSRDVGRIGAEKIFREIAANMNSTFLAVLNAIVSGIFRRMFASIEVSGLEKVAGYAKRHPLVLVPSHRSYFDFLILSVLFYSNHLVPPHIAARENMGFGPFGFIFRRGGAFFLRRSFADPLYKEIFRRYVGYLVKEGFTQEFFIEGGRSRTGKTLVPRLGMLSWDLDAFLSCTRRDLFFVPIAITYERLVEESAMVEEIEGGKKTEESTLGLLRARKFLQRRFGSVFVNFGEPISLAEALGARRERFASDESQEVEEEKRQFVEALAQRLVERINWATVVNATSVAACAILAGGARGLLRHELTRRMQLVVDLLRLQDVGLTPALARDGGDFREAIAFLLRADLLRSATDARGEILYFDESRRRALDFYRNTILHYLAAPSFLARACLAGGTRARLGEELAFWIELFYQEFFVPRGEVLAAHLDGYLDYFERCGHIEWTEAGLRATEKGIPYFRFLAAQTACFPEAYLATFSAVLEAEPNVGARRLERAVRDQLQHSQILGEATRPEAASPITFQNAIDLLVRRGVLERRKGSEGGGAPRDVVVQRGPAFDDLRALRERLAAALAAR
ncbi:MAG: 1-acyl-sn-glycerol-3-phosphate acyltransferase [Deltaproteobacteria bacterium]|nr:1-acyl-sn-glycerol-3-phosphate acyltransferase [Deltaproteobacteria bacterium]